MELIVTLSLKDSIITLGISITLNVILLGVIMLSLVMLSALMLRLDMLIVTLPNVVAPQFFFLTSFAYISQKSTSLYTGTVCYFTFKLSGDLFTTGFAQDQGLLMRRIANGTAYVLRFQ